MRWSNIKPNPQTGDTRTVHRFLWRPLQLNGETRWLEFAGIKQKFLYTIWEDVEWVPDTPWFPPRPTPPLAYNPPPNGVYPPVPPPTPAPPRTTHTD